MLTNLKYCNDDRRESLYDLFSVLPGQINISYVPNINTIIGLHKHVLQTDYLFCLKGSFKVCLVEEAIQPVEYYEGIAWTQHYKVKWEYLSEKEPKVLTILPKLWHGFKALQPDSCMLYYLDKKYNPNDEYKVNPFSFDIKWDIESK